MKLIRVAVLIAAGSFAPFSLAQDAPPGGAVEGTVVNSATGAGIGGASVVLFGDQSRRYQATSDAVGHFRVTGMVPGSYRANVEKDGFASPALDLASFLSSSGLRVVSGIDPAKVELKLTPLSAFRGRVLDPDGKPAQGVEVNLNPNMLGSVVTDREGRFELEKVRPGSYTLSARPPESSKPEVASDGTKIAMVTTYYPSVADQSLAQQIVFQGQGDLNGYDVRMQTAPVHRVRGIVLDEEGKPVPEAELTLFPIPEGTPGPMGLGRRAGGPSFFALGLRPGPSGAPEATVIAGKDGRFEFPAVRSGEWRINAESETIRGDAQNHALIASSGTTGALVGRGDVDDLQIQVATPFRLRGRVEWKSDDSGSQRVSNPGLPMTPVTLINPDGNEFVRSGFAESGAILFETLLPGRYRAIVQPGVSAQIFLGENEVTGVFPVAAGGPPLRVVLKTWSGSIRGTVEKGDGATVVLVPQRVEGVAFGQTVTCGAGGSFELNEVSPGDYYIAAFDRLDGLWPSAALLGLVPSRGTSVKVEEHATANVNLSVVAAPR